MPGTAAAGGRDALAKNTLLGRRRLKCAASEILGALGVADSISLMSLISFAGLADDQPLRLAALEA
jgi:hypothetical protein